MCIICRSPEKKRSFGSEIEGEAASNNNKSLPREKNAIINCHNNSNHNECSSIDEDEFVMGAGASGTT